MLIPKPAQNAPPPQQQQQHAGGPFALVHNEVFQLTPREESGELESALASRPDSRRPASTSLKSSEPSSSRGSPSLLVKSSTCRIRRLVPARGSSIVSYIGLCTDLRKRARVQSSVCVHAGCAWRRINLFHSTTHATSKDRPPGCELRGPRPGSAAAPFGCP